jgi:hypothetical protein
MQWYAFSHLHVSQQNIYSLLQVDHPIPLGSICPFKPLTDLIQNFTNIDKEV